MIYKPSDDSWLLEKQIPKYASGKSCLDMGTGSGILAEACDKAKSKTVLAVDINPEAIKLLKSKKIPSIKSNLFSNVKGKYDLIIFNPPYLPLDAREPLDSRLATTGGKNGDELVIKFLKQAPNYLNKNGIILLLLSSLTPRDEILDLLSKLGLKHQQIARKKIFQEQLEVWEIRI